MQKKLRKYMNTRACSQRGPDTAPRAPVRTRTSIKDMHVPPKPHTERAVDTAHAAVADIDETRRVPTAQVQMPGSGVRRRHMRTLHPGAHESPHAGQREDSTATMRPANTPLSSKIRTASTDSRAATNGDLLRPTPPRRTRHRPHAYAGSTRDQTPNAKEHHCSRTCPHLARTLPRSCSCRGGRSSGVGRDPVASGGARAPHQRRPRKHNKQQMHRLRAHERRSAHAGPCNGRLMAR